MRKALLRRQNQAMDDEDAAELKLGPEFQNEHCLLHAEVKILMDKLKQADGQLIDASSTITTADRHQLGPAFHKTLAYVSHTCKFNNPETVKEVRKVLMDTHLEPFEMAQLANLLPHKADEAKALVPSLTYRKEDDDLQQVLNELHGLERFQ